MINLLMWIFLAILSGLVLIRNSRKVGLKERCGWYLSFTAVLILYLFSAKPVSNMLIYSLERNYQLPSKEALSNLDAMVILAGGVRPSRASPSGAEASGTTYSRLVSGVYIFKANNARLLVLQGTSSLDIESDAAVMGELARQLGVSQERIIVEKGSRNTYEHAIELRKLFPASRKLRLGIVTSALHMRRSEMVFKWKFPKDVIVPIPVDCRYSTLKYKIKDFIPSIEALSASNDALHELIGMVWYSLKHDRGD